MPRPHTRHTPVSRVSGTSTQASHGTARGRQTHLIASVVIHLRTLRRRARATLCVVLHYERNRVVLHYERNQHLHQFCRQHYSVNGLPLAFPRAQLTPSNPTPSASHRRAHARTRAHTPGSRRREMRSGEELSIAARIAFRNSEVRQPLADAAMVRFPGKETTPLRP